MACLLHRIWFGWGGTEVKCPDEFLHHYVGVTVFCTIALGLFIARITAGTFTLLYGD